MATTRFLDDKVLSSGDTMLPAEALDCGDSNTLVIAVTVQQACEGDAPVLVLGHSPTTEEGDWLDFPDPVHISLRRTGRTWYFVPYFSRYVGWWLTGDLGSEAKATVDVVSKS